MRFNSKKDNWLSIIILLTVGLLMASLLTSYMTNALSIVAFIMLTITLLVSSVFLIWCWYATYYILTDNLLIIRSGPIKKVIEYTSIKSLQKTSNPLSGPALSMKRIEIIHGMYQVILISPENRDDFITILQDKSPQIEIKTEA